jgi:serine/threonine protein kinase
MGDREDTPVPMMVDPLRDFERAKDDKIEIIADRYVVKQMLGQGGMGRVFRGHDKLLNRDVAVKMLNRELCDEYFIDLSSIRRLSNELNIKLLESRPNAALITTALWIS